VVEFEEDWGVDIQRSWTRLRTVVSLAREIKCAALNE